MTRLLLLLLVLVLSGCGTARHQSSNDGVVQPPPKVLDLVSMTGANGTVSVEPAPLTPARDLARFTSDFRGDALRHQIQAVLDKRSVSDAMYAAGAVIAVGCDVPPGADVVTTNSGYQVVPKEVASPREECLAPVTTVAIVALPRPTH